MIQKHRRQFVAKTYSKDMYQDKTYDANGRLEKVVFRCGYKDPITQKYKLSFSNPLLSFIIKG